MAIPISRLFNLEAAMARAAEAPPRARRGPLPGFRDNKPASEYEGGVKPGTREYAQYQNQKVMAARLKARQEAGSSEGTGGTNKVYEKGRIEDPSGNARYADPDIEYNRTLSKEPYRGRTKGKMVEYKPNPARGKSLESQAAEGNKRAQWYLDKREERTEYLKEYHRRKQAGELPQDDDWWPLEE